MDIKSKLAFAENAIKSISTHDDVDAQVRFAALDKLDQMIEDEREGIRVRVEKAVAASVG